MTTATLDLDRLIEAKERGAKYLASRQNADGSVGDPSGGLGSYYKAPWALAGAGRAGAGAHLVTWIREHMLAENGDIDGEPGRGPVFGRLYAYPNAWITCGAQKLGQFDVGLRGAEFLMTLQHPETGGFRSKVDDPDSLQDVMSSCQAGNAALYTGHVDAARNVARFLATVWEAQPEPDDALYFMYKPGSGLLTEVPEERRKIAIVSASEERQHYFQIGIAAAFLTKLTLATGEREHLDLAAKYLDLAHACTDGMYETAQVGKVGWGAALLFGATGDERTGALAQRVGDALLQQQNDDGSWYNTGGYTTDAVTDEVTAEFVALLDEMIQGMASAG
jgi:hypothetical protein